MCSVELETHPKSQPPSGPLAPPERAEASGSYHLDLILRSFLVRVVGGKILAKICILEFFSLWEEENSILASDIIMEEIYEFFLVLDEVFA